MERKNTSRTKLYILLFLALSLLAFCMLMIPLALAEEQKDGNRPLTNEELFQKARRHMERPERFDIRPLVTLTPEDEGVYFDTGTQRVLMVAFLEAVDPFVTSAADKKIFLSGNVWCFSQRELEKWYAKHLNDLGKDLRMRMRMVTGLAPDAAEQYFVTFWASPDDMLRPANVTNPKIDRMEARKPTNAAERTVTSNTMMNLKQFQLDPRRKKKTAKVKTRLGYTYDWGRPGHQYGLTEFMVVPFVQIEVVNIYDFQQYMKHLEAKVPRN